jgi:hypothetical protein
VIEEVGRPLVHFTLSFGVNFCGKLWMLEHIENLVWIVCTGTLGGSSGGSALRESAKQVATELDGAGAAKNGFPLAVVEQHGLETGNRFLLKATFNLRKHAEIAQNVAALTI